MSHLKLFSPHQLSVFWPEDDAVETPRQASAGPRQASAGSSRQASSDDTDTHNGEPVRLRLIWPEKHESPASENPNLADAASTHTAKTRTAKASTQRTRTANASLAIGRARLSGPHWNRTNMPELAHVTAANARREQRSFQSAAVIGPAEPLAWPGETRSSSTTDDRRQKSAGDRGWKSNKLTPLQRAQALHANRCCPDCGAAAVIPLSSEHAVAAGDQMPIPGAGELLGFQCGICEHRWSINHHHE